MSVEGLFHTFSLEFAGLFPTIKRGNRFLLICVEHLAGWSVSHAYQMAISEKVLNFLRNHIVAPFEAPVTILTDNPQCFAAHLIAQYAEKVGICWIFVSAYNA